MLPRLMSLFGIVVLLGIAWLMSNNKRRINYRTVVVGLSIQFVLGFLLLYWQPGQVGYF